MKLTVSKRDNNKKNEAKRLRREGFIPAIVYSAGKQGENVSIKASEFQTHLRHIKRGHLPTTVFTLVKDDGKESKSIIKDIQYHITTYDVLHLDFEELQDDKPVNVKVPIEFIGAADCIGVKLSGVLRQVIRYLRVRCLPKDIPSSFGVDVKDLNIKDTKKLRDIVIPEGVRPMANMNEVVVVVAKR